MAPSNYSHVRYFTSTAGPSSGYMQLEDKDPAAEAMRAAAKEARRPGATKESIKEAAEEARLVAERGPWEWGAIYSTQPLYSGTITSGQIKTNTITTTAANTAPASTHAAISWYST